MSLSHVFFKKSFFVPIVGILLFVYTNKVSLTVFSEFALYAMISWRYFTIHIKFAWGKNHRPLFYLVISTVIWNIICHIVPIFLDF